MTAPAGETSTPITAAELLGRVTSEEYRITRTVPILVAPHALTDEHAELEAAFEQAAAQDVAMGDNTSQVIAERLEAVERQLETFMVPFKVGAVPKRAWADLLAAHAPTKVQRREDERVEFNPDTFPAAAIAACIIEPALTAEQIDVLENGRPVDPDDPDGERVGGLSDTQFNTLFNATVRVNMSGLSAPKSVAVGVLRRASAASLPLPTISESPDRSSLDG